MKYLTERRRREAEPLGGDWWNFVTGKHQDGGNRHTEPQGSMQFSGEFLIISMVAPRHASINRHQCPRNRSAISRRRHPLQYQYVEMSPGFRAAMAEGERLGSNILSFHCPATPDVLGNCGIVALMPHVNGLYHDLTDWRSFRFEVGRGSAYIHPGAH
jgi:hypothetical protein